MIERLYDGTLPVSVSCGRRRAPNARSRARAPSRVLMALRACSPWRCARSMACGSVSACCPDAGCARVNASVSESVAHRVATRGKSSRIVMGLLVAKARDGVLLRGAPGGNDAEDDADGNRHAKGDDNGDVRHEGLDASEVLDAGAE